MEQKLRILHLEDSGNDAELIREDLADKEVGCERRTLSTRSSGAGSA